MKDALISLKQFLTERGKLDALKLKERKDKWPEYLRLIDAMSAPEKPSFGELAKVLYPNEEDTYPRLTVSNRLSKSHVTAAQIMEHGFMQIAAMGLANPPKGK